MSPCLGAKTPEFYCGIRPYVDIKAAFAGRRKRSASPTTDPAQSRPGLAPASSTVRHACYTVQLMRGVITERIHLEPSKLN
jgi:hypothetical protein